MQKRGIKILTAALCLFFCLALFGCGGQKKRDANTLIYGSQDYTAINPALYEHGEINALLFAGLTAHDENNRVVPALAESWRFDEDNLTYIFNLRENLTFHDGQPLTSADVKFTLQAILDEKNHSEIVSNYKDIEEIRCPDEKTVEIQLSRFNAAFPDYMSVGILPAHLLEGEELSTCSFNQNPVGAGPYQLKSWDRGQSITMEGFDDYWSGAPSIETVVFKIVPDADARVMQLLAGDIDMAQITAKTAEEIEEKGTYNVYRMDTADYRAIAYNFGGCRLFRENPQLANILSYGIDRQAILDGVLLGEGEIAYSPLQKGAYNNEQIHPFTYDPDKVVKLLFADGWVKDEDGYFAKNGTQLAFTISAMSDDPVRVEMAKMCAEQFQKLGVNAKAEAKPSLDWENQDCCIIGWGSPFDPDDHTYKVFTTGAGDNYTGYTNPQIDDLLRKARNTDDEAARRSLYAEFQQEMTEAMPYTFIAYVDATYAVKKEIRGITPDKVLGHHGVGVFWNIADWEMEDR